MISMDNVIEGHITKEFILRRVSELDMFFYYIPSFKSLGRKFMSELRDDGRFPSASVIHYNGRLLYKEFGGGGKTHDIFSYVQEKFNLTFHEALKVIANDFGLLKVNKLPTMEYFGVTIDIKPIEQQVKKEIKVKYREWNNEDKAYWEGRYYISTDLLQEYQVYPLYGYFYGTNFYPSGKILTYGYYDFSGKWKIYRPLSENKWPVGNFTKDIIDGWSEVKPGDKCVITSSRKDRMCWGLFQVDSFNWQSETIIPLEEHINILRKNYPKIYLNQDDDFAGHESTDKIISIYPDLIPIFVGKEHKDLSGYLWKERYEKTKELIDGMFNKK